MNHTLHIILNGVNYKIPFNKITNVQRYGRAGYRVTYQDAKGKPHDILLYKKDIVKGSEFLARKTNTRSPELTEKEIEAFKKLLKAYQSGHLNERNLENSIKGISRYYSNNLRKKVRFYALIALSISALILFALSPSQAEMVKLLGNESPSTAALFVSDRNPGKLLGLPDPIPHNQMVPGGMVTSLYGNRVSPISGFSGFHAGLDIAAPEGTPILAPIDLCAKEVIADGDGSGFGNYLIMSPPGRDDEVEITFAHNFKNVAVQGKCYKTGETIALLGNTGNSTGAHLHIEITDITGKSDPNGSGLPWEVDPGEWWGGMEIEL